MLSGIVFAVAFAGEVEPRSGGRLAVSDARTTFAPLIFDSDWKRHEGKPNGSHCFQIADKGNPVVDGRAEFKAGARTVDATWRMTALREWQGNGAYVAADFPVDAYDGGWIANDGKMRPLSPESGKNDPTLFHGVVSELFICGKDGKPRLTLKFPRSARVRFQDNRKWGQKSYSLRLEVAGKRFRAGEEFELACSLDGAAPLSFISNKEETITAGADWIPLVAKSEVKSGSALDFSRLCGERKPAGSFGRVVRCGGHFEFERLPGIPQRFYGVNLCGSANTPPPAQARPFAARLAQMGYNAVRVHHHEKALTKADGFTLDPEKMSRFREFVDACTENGLYITTDLFVSRGPISYRSIGENRDGNVDSAEYKELVIFHEGAFSNYLGWARQFLGHVHPATGRRLAEEPALAWLSLVNEGNLGNCGMRWMRKYPIVVERWREWLAERRRADPNAYCGIPDGLPVSVSLEDNMSAHLAAFTVFMGDLERMFIARVRRFLKDEMSCRALVTDMNSWRYPAAFQLVRGECLDFSDEHHYYDHPEFEGARWQMPTWCGNGNPFTTPNMGAPNLVVRRIWGQPFVVSEYGYCAPSSYRSVGGLVIGALAALQDWSGVWRFAWSHGLQGAATSEAKAIRYFDLSGDPLSLAAERAAVCLFLRGDLKPHEETYLLHLPKDRLRSPEVPAPIATVRWPWGAWFAKTGSALDGDSMRGAQVAGTSPDVFSKTEDEVRHELSCATKRVLPVVINGKKGTFTVTTSRTCGVFAEEGKVSTGVLDVELKGARATVWASSLDGAALSDSKQILVSHLTDVLDSGTRFGDSRHRKLLAWGELPHLMRNGTAHISLAVGQGACRVYALSADGSRRGIVPSTTGRAGMLRFTAKIDSDPNSATWLYEITKEK